MHTRVGQVILADQLVLGIRIHVVLVAVEALAVLLGPARVLVFLPVLRHGESRPLAFWAMCGVRFRCANAFIFLRRRINCGA
jgi:hypothetical protein